MFAVATILITIQGLTLRIFNEPEPASQASNNGFWRRPINALGTSDVVVPHGGLGVLEI